MKITKLTLLYYQFKKVPKVGNFKAKLGWSIHEVINRQAGFKSDVKHHNDIAYLRMIYSNYKLGFISKRDFLEKLGRRNYIKRYVIRFK